MGEDYARRAALQAVWERARRFAGAGGLPRVLVMTDPRRPDPQLHLWPGPVGVILRHFGQPDRGHDLRQRTLAGGHTLLIGDDPELAVECGADGVHFRRETTHDIAAWRRRVPEWTLTQAAPYAGPSTSPVDAFLVSAVFPSRSPSAGTPIGVEGLRERARALPAPVFALGGVHAGTLARLPASIAGVAGVSFQRETSMTDDLKIEKHTNGSDIRFTATHPDFAGLEAELDLKGAGEGEYAATHTGVPREMEGRGVGSALYRAMVADAREQGYRVIPVCPFIVAKAKRDKTAADVFAKR